MVTHWILGVILGLIAGASMLSLGILSLIVAGPALAWAAVERYRPVGLAGSLVGAGVAIGGLPALAVARCSAFGTSVDGVNESCTSPDVTPLLAVALALVITGTVMTVVAARRGAMHPTA